MWRPGRRLFSVASILILITAALHTFGNVLPRNTAPIQSTLDAMRAAHLPMGMGMEPAVYDIFRDLVFTMSVTFVALGVVGLMLTGSKSVSSAVIRNMTWFYLGWNGVFTVLCFYYRVAPPLICGVIIEVVLLVAVLIPGKNTEDAAAAKV